MEIGHLTMISTLGAREKIWICQVILDTTVRLTAYIYINIDG